MGNENLPEGPGRIAQGIITYLEICEKEYIDNQNKGKDEMENENKQ